MDTFSWQESPCKLKIPYYKKLTLHEIKVLEINANLMENVFRIKKFNAKEEVEFISTLDAKNFKTEQNWAEITSDSDNNEDQLEIL